MLIDLDEITKRIIKICNKKSSRRCFIQVPEGLTHLAHELSRRIIMKGVEGIVSVDPCFGACDIPYWKAKELGCDLIIHIGHAPMPTIKVPFDVEFIEVFYEVKVREDLIEELSKKILSMGFKSVGLVATAQYLKLLAYVRTLLEKHGLKVFIGKSSGRALYDGQVLGCNVSSAKSVSEKVDAYIFIGDGTFHPVAVYLAIGKPVLAFNPITGEIKDVRDLGERVLRVRLAHMMKASEARSFSVVVTSKVGQYSEELLRTVVNALKKFNREYSIIHLENIGEVLNYMKNVDVFVIIGCPRIVYDDYLKFKRPIITGTELLLSLSRKFKDWKFMEMP